MRYVTLALIGIGLSALAWSCASVRTTGPKTSLDRCVDRCELSAKWCEHPMYQTGCGVEYDACVVQCDPSANAARSEPHARM